MSRRRWLSAFADTVERRLRARKDPVVRRPHARHIRTCASFYRAMGSQGRLAYVLGINQSNVSRLVRGESISTAAHFADEVERLERGGRNTAPLRAYIDQVAEDARAASPAPSTPALGRTL